MKTDENGFHIVEISLAIFIVAVIGLVFWRVADDHHSKTTVSSSTAATVKPVSENSINSKADLESATQSLDSVSQESNQTTSDLNQLKQVSD